MFIENNYLAWIDYTDFRIPINPFITNPPCVGKVALSTFSPEMPRRSWWRHRMETFSALLALCAGNSPDTGEFPSQRPVTLSFDVFFDLHLNKRLRKQSWGWWFETLSRPLWRYCNVDHDEVKTDQMLANMKNNTFPMISTVILP